MNKVKELLKKKVGPFPVGVWLLILAGGTVVGLLLRSRTSSTEEDTAGSVLVGGDEMLPALPGSEGAIGVPYPYLGGPTQFDQLLEALYRDGYTGNNLYSNFNGDGFNTEPDSSEPTLDPSAFSIKLASGEYVYQNPRDFTAKELEGATLYTPRDNDLENTDIWATVKEGRVNYGYQTDIADAPKVVSKPLENYLNTAQKNCERIRKNPEWYTAEQRAACGVG